jgi:hypothetical protein
VASISALLQENGLTSAESKRVADYASMAQSLSRVDVFLGYLTGLGISVVKAQITNWRRLRGALVHAAESDSSALEAMSEFRSIVRQAVLLELRKVRVSGT